MELVVVSKTRLLEQASSSNSNYPQAGRDDGDEGRSVGAQDIDTSGYQVSDLDNIEFYWEIDQLDVDAVFRPILDTPFSPTALDDLEMGESGENPILLDKEENKNFPPTTLVSDRVTRPPALLRSRPFGTRIENVPDYVYRNLFQ